MFESFGAVVHPWNQGILLNWKIRACGGLCETIWLMQLPNVRRVSACGDHVADRGQYREAALSFARIAELYFYRRALFSFTDRGAA